MSGMGVSASKGAPSDCLWPAQSLLGYGRPPPPLCRALAAEAIGRSSSAENQDLVEGIVILPVSSYKLSSPKWHFILLVISIVYSIHSLLVMVEQSFQSDLFPPIGSHSIFAGAGVSSRADYDDIYKWKYDQESCHGFSEAVNFRKQVKTMMFNFLWKCTGCIF